VLLIELNTGRATRLFTFCAGRHFDSTLCPQKNYNPRQCKIEMSNPNAS